MTSRPNPELSDLLAEVDTRVSEYWLFHCECGADGCNERVSLTVAEYATLREQRHPVLAHGHRLSRSEQARRRSRNLIEDASALIAQSRQQIRRATRWGAEPRAGA